MNRNSDNPEDDRPHWKDLELWAAQFDWSHVPKSNRRPQEWFDDTDNPFEPDKELAS